MESLILVPAVIALLGKAVIYVYASCSRQEFNKLTSLYLFFLFSLSIQNFAEVLHFVDLSHDITPTLSLDFYYIGSIAAVSTAFHMAKALVFPEQRVLERVAMALHVLALVLILLVAFSQLVIVGYERNGYSATRIPGPLFPIFQCYAVTALVWTIGALAYGSFRGSTPNQRNRAAWMLLGFLPVAGLAITILVLLQFGIKSVNATVMLPIAITFFLAVSAYVIHRHRVFDIRFFVPWTRYHRQRRHWYAELDETRRRIRAGLSSQEILSILSGVLKRPVRLVANRHTVAASAGEWEMKRFPVDQLWSVRNMTFYPDEPNISIQFLMDKFDIDFIAPTFDQLRSTRAWVLVARGDSDIARTPEDLCRLRELFTSVCDVFEAGTLRESFSLDEEVGHFATQMARHASINGSGVGYAFDGPLGSSFPAGKFKH